MASLERGDQSPEVGIAQKILKAFGYGIEVDNDYGEITERLVKKFQEEQCFEVTGIYDQQTRVQLESLVEYAKNRETLGKVFKMKLIRKVDSGKSTIGELYIDGEFFCYTLELPWKENKNQVSCIPPGKRRVRIRPGTDSVNFRYDHLHIMDVPNRTWILIHVANYPRDILGCVGVGSTKDVDFVGNSRVTFKGLMELIKEKMKVYDEMEIEIVKTP